MATIILAKDDLELQTFPLSKERTTIGRRTYNDIVIDAPGISAEHAVIVTSSRESHFEDLESTNGSQFNGQPIKNHLLHDRDLIALATYTIQYRSEEVVPSVTTQSVSAGVSKEELGDMEQITVPSQRDMTVTTNRAVIRILSGFGVGKEIVLTKALTTIGRPGLHVAVLASSEQGHSLTHVEGEIYPVVNGVSIGVLTQPLVSGDRIRLADTEMMFVVDG
ncbi:FHA domain-containing protein [Herminiimonas arsenitoxidans]|uniref:FHA domain-containing protein n=1 Tax=Herminiimonas arsenitoxidans TaxID=1809410 RepID=UPI000970CC50|nr:FHA domain-containing protein [Herminiimonas arsenitoxidans]